MVQRRCFKKEKKKVVHGGPKSFTRKKRGGKMGLFLLGGGTSPNRRKLAKRRLSMHPFSHRGAWGNRGIKEIPLKIWELPRLLGCSFTLVENLSEVFTFFAGEGEGTAIQEGGEPGK